MSDFDKRINKAKLLIDEVIKFLDENNINYILSGYEYLKSTMMGEKMIKKNDDKTSLFIRHYPDISLIYPNKSCLLEVKNSTGIEKYCYENYLSLNQKLKLNVFLYLRNHKICNISDLLFKKMDELDPIANMKIPVIDGIWKNPRAMNDNQYYAYKEAYSQLGKYTSGCSFAFIDFGKTRFYERTILIPSKNI